MIAAVDIGNSKTDVLLLDKQGDVVSWSSTGAIALTYTSPRDTARALRSLLPSGAQISRMWIGAAGADFPDQEEEFAAEVRLLDSFGEVTVRNDIFALLGCVRIEGSGIAVVAGAGMNAVGVTGDQVVRFAALGELSGDLGGGGYLGARAVSMACRGADGRGSATALTGALLEYFDVATADELSRGLSNGRLPASHLLKLGPIVFDRARDGDEVALSLVREQAIEVQAFIRATASRMDREASSLPIALGGSILRFGQDLLEPAIRGGFPEEVLDLHFIDFPPVVGAAVEGLRLEGVTVEPAAIASQLSRLRSQKIPVESCLSST